MYTKKTIITHLLCKCILFYHGLICIHDLRLKGLGHCLANNSLKSDHWEYLDWKVKKDECSSYEFLSLLTVGDGTRFILTCRTFGKWCWSPSLWVGALITFQPCYGQWGGKKKSEEDEFSNHIKWWAYPINDCHEGMGRDFYTHLFS